VKRTIALCSIVLLAALGTRGYAQDQEPLSLSLEDAIVKALKNNLNVAVSVYGPELADANVSLAREAFLPRLDLSYNSQRNENPSYWFLQGEGTIWTTENDYAATIVQRVQTGASINLSLSSYKTDTNQSYQSINPRYGSTLRLDITQPLLRNFGFKVNRREVLVAQNNLDISRSQLEATLQDTVYQAQEAYWNLVYAIENYKVNQQSLQLARDLLVKSRKEVEVGVLAPLEVLNAEAVVAQREADILQAEALIKRSEDVLRSLINLSGDQASLARPIVPSDKPAFVKKDVSLEASLSEALARRPDLAAARKTIDTSEINFSVARNQMLPGLDLQFSYWSPGISGDRIRYLDDNPFLGVIIGKDKGSASGSLRDALKLLYNNWSVGLTLSLPLSNFLTRAQFAQAQLDLGQNQARLKSQEQQVTLDVKDAVRSIETDAKRVEAYRVARELAEKRLEAEEKKLRVGLTTNYFVLQYQGELANARSMEIKSLIDYNLSWARFEKAVGASLDNHGIKVSDITAR
jgi:outer membrane protein TolC